ncbi:inosine guanosine and xanthosine phosphorylase family [Caldicellulosiruptor saccharolyticus DSM 8903]|uniref:Purine nucleoside phosphorylase n=1 Tax=Caldicellulosiruptor saccharolyticus (strain ATCC 43494 / DSM 8903 / Tp8T 6331) TaxID=351627 RepID=A4XLV8_CALS8|nr:purine-nucleoside phosphorylase [Caldicellulosiruptor saccharolyticus]ABP67893.1 inosine guanosine and xanthosine phosphorylase family [Caldicellulosiruptor saccharolyticus DSM 8903]
MYYQKVKDAAEFIQRHLPQIPEIAIILGSGLGEFAETIEDKIVLKYSDIPHFPVSTVKGHKGNLIFGNVKGRKVLAFQGRFHLYEGYKVEEVVFGVRVAGLLGVKNLIVTNAAGGISQFLSPGDLMVIKDHINLSGENPAIGEDAQYFGERFFDMTYAYDKETIEKAKDVYKKNGVDYKEGVYAFLKGPSYETPSEIRMLKILGADAVGMSTVPEVIAARQMGIRVFGISCITNMAAGILDKKLSHEEVIEVSKAVEEKFIKIIRDIIEIM